MKNTISIIDTFTSNEFNGNPAAVYHMFDNKTTEWMQSFAAEINLSETAFLKRNKDNKWDLKWFTPKSEVDLCGHATLASAHYLWGENIVPNNQAIKFYTKSGILKCEKGIKYIYLYFPLFKISKINQIEQLNKSLGDQPDSLIKTNWDLIAVFKSPDQVKNLRPKFDELNKFSSRGVIVTAPGYDKFDFIARFFAPNLRINEDYVTGSIFCSLGPYWSMRLGLKYMTAYQASIRPGVIDLKVYNDKVRIGGEAKTILLGKSI